MSLDVTVGYGGSSDEKPRTMVVRPTHVVRGSETLAALEDEGWGDVEHGFFVAGVVIDGVGKHAPAKPARDWRRFAGVGALLFLGLMAVLVAVRG